MQCRAEEVCLLYEQDLGAFNLSEVEALDICLLAGVTDRVAVWRDVVTEVLRVINDSCEDVFLFWLERQSGDFGLPFDKVFELWTCGVTRDFDAPVADWASIFLVFLDLATCDLQAFTVVPRYRVLVIFYAKQY